MMSSAMSVVQVTTPGGNYPIHIAANRLQQLAQSVPTDATTIALITNPTVFELYGESVLKALQSTGKKVVQIQIPDGEAYKNTQTLNHIFDRMLQGRLDRKAVIVALGGGVVGDISGLAAACFMRGIRFIQVPTTLLSQVDSSVGGKTAINHPLGKNMIGSFYQPEKVYIDLEVLSTLDNRDWKSGLAEIIKYGIIKDKEFFEYIEKNIEKIKDRDLQVFEYLIKRSCEIKGEIVIEDEREEGVRALLNLGHTLAHGIETITEYEYFRHGEAVAAGISVITDFAAEKGYLLIEDQKRIQNIFANLEMIYKLPKMPIKVFMDILNLDKKNHMGNLVIIMPKTIGEAIKIDKVNRTELEEFLLRKGICIK